jgi:ribosomal protein L11 methyltransferase
MSNYKEFTITSTPFVPEMLQGMLWELDISGIQEEEDHIKVFCDEANSTNQKEISDQLQKLVNENVIRSFSIDEKVLENKNWNEEWEKSREVIVVSETLVIKPSFKEYSAKPNQIVITIDPKMSFGTGEHQSTQLSLLFLEKYVKKGMKILDVGTGTAVLAIASVKFGADKVIAIDNDECCYENSIENCKVNSVTEKVDIRLCEIKDVNEKNFDLIAANIQRDILLQIKNEIQKRLAKNGFLILSGLLIQDQAEIQKEYESLDFTLLDSKISSEWISLVLQLS